LGNRRILLIEAALRRFPNRHPCPPDSALLRNLQPLTDGVPPTPSVLFLRPTCPARIIIAT
jgi:hypothetical protein